MPHRKVFSLLQVQIWSLKIELKGTNFPPIQQYKRFSEQEQIRQNLGKDGLEYQPMDRDYVRALEYGMPPAGGVGWGLGRFFMLLTNNESLREVIAFPILRTIKKKEIKTVSDYFPETLDWYS